ncbi:sulfite exporter TauE/SafE family protein [Cytobacillus purgationiresistens]|uniref:Probable membrane transporter protein n=1 Tax=Cytobacillus purgationiresistens TaxID=863449 RepID=A0ABU0AI89_9BACI|nr:sulfite exporter TauE/SafE family protein [Cytobacillus purgationiresistens]MDQ0270502.1 putative membrane protein YfcA [Cytobacillus purgationiresistens]
MEYILFFILGGLISVLSGFFGIGGGFILTPFLMLIGYPPIEAIATSLLFTIGSSISGIAAHIKLKNIKWKEGIILGVSGVAATQVAHPFVVFLERNGMDEWAIPLLYIVLLSYFALRMMKQGNGQTQNQTASSTASMILKMIAIGFFAGFVSTAMGVGGGFIMVPLTVALLGFIPKKAVGTSLFAVLLIVTTGFLSYASTVAIDYQVGLVLLAGGLIGSQFGAKLTNSFSNREITLLLGCLYLSTLASVILKVFHLAILGLSVVGLFILFFFITSFFKIRLNKVQSQES